MFVCEKNYSCCDYQYWDRQEDVEPEAKECGHLIEVAPVVHGKWTTHRTEKHDGEWYCTECDYEPEVFTGSNFCPNCGANMVLEE